MLLTDKKNTRKGFSFTEIIIATFALSILMLGFAGFTSNIFDISASHAGSIKNVSQSRFSTERITTQLNKAAYIYPAAVNLNLGGGTIINTSDSVGMLIPESDGKYRFVAYYINNNAQGSSDLYEYFSNNTYTWTENTCPATDIISFTGSASVLANNLNKAGTVLNYVLSYENAPSDTILKGNISNTAVTDKIALIQGIEWNILQRTANNEVIQIKGISKNVPRYIE